MRIQRIRQIAIERANCSDVLDWRSATAADRTLLRDFCCTEPANPVFNEETEDFEHDLPWELEVQDHVQRLHTPLTFPNYLLLGFLDSELAAVLEVIVTPLDNYCFVAILAVSQELSGRGYAGEALAQVEGVMRSCGISNEYTVEALVDRDNFSAKSVFEKGGYHSPDNRNGYERWLAHF